MKTTPSKFIILVIAFVACASSALAQVPQNQTLSYQGRVVVNGTNFNSTPSNLGQFMFALVNTGGTTTYWSNDGSSTHGGRPGSAVALTVTNGLYSVVLGDATNPNMTPIPTSVFGNQDLHLRIWFNDGTHGPQQLSPDQTVTAVAYAVSAGTASTVSNGAIGTAQLAPGVGLPPGSIIPYGGTVAPAGYLLCNGAAVSQTTYAALFSAIGTAYGAGDQSGTTFSVPDLRGCFLRGVDAGSGRDPDAANRMALNAGGAVGNNVGTLQSHAFASHSHTLTSGIGIAYTTIQPVTNGQNDFWSDYGYNGTNAPWTPANGVGTAPVGGSETRPINVSVNYIIKY
jgi:microcystin-dependent protein